MNEELRIKNAARGALSYLTPHSLFFILHSPRPWKGRCPQGRGVYVRHAYTHLFVLQDVETRPRHAATYAANDAQHARITMRNAADNDVSHARITMRNMRG
jgi:hypothetical protein